MLKWFIIIIVLSIIKIKKVVKVRTESEEWGKFAKENENCWCLPGNMMTIRRTATKVGLIRTFLTILLWINDHGSLMKVPPDLAVMP